MEIVVHHTATVEECQERLSRQTGVGIVSKHGVKVVSARQVGQNIERIFSCYHVGDAGGRRSREVHDATVGSEEDGGIDLGDAVWVDTHVAGDGLTGGEGAIVGHLESPDTIGAESIERELSELALGECFCSGRDTEDGTGAN